MVTKRDYLSTSLTQRYHWAALLSTVCLALFLAACATRPFESADIRTEVPLGAVALFDQKQVPVDRKAASNKKQHLQILALSGGGSNGAFGAGVLKGWTKTGKRPQFDIVTGVSTGALIATLAFLGPEYDDTLENFYTQTDDTEIYQSKGFFGVFSDAFLDYTPLKKRIETIITTQLLDKIGAEHKLGRRLYVGTTNLDAGELVVWDMGVIAASSHPQRVRVFQKILRASAAVPGFFKPVYIRPILESKARQMHVDGGVKAPVLIRNFMFNLPAKKRTLHVIVNGQISLADAQSAVKPEVADISRKTINELLRGLLYKTLYQGYATARNARTDFRLIAIPDHENPAKDPLRFNPKEMRRIFALGERLGQTPKNWKNEPPRLTRFERIAADRRKQR